MKMAKPSVGKKNIARELDLQHTNVLERFAEEYVKYPILHKSYVHQQKKMRCQAYESIARALRLPLSRQQMARHVTKFRNLYMRKLRSYARAARARGLAPGRALDLAPAWLARAERSLGLLPRVLQGMQATAAEGGAAGREAARVLAALVRRAARRRSVRARDVCAPPAGGGGAGGGGVPEPQVLECIWSRVTGVTMKKLHFLISMGDCAADVRPPAAMTPADWRLADLMLLHSTVHERPLVTEDSVALYEQLQPLVVLFHLAQQFELEESAPRAELARRWACARAAYADRGTPVSAVLLQRRWYELKLQARGRVVGAWRQLEGAPDPLPIHTAIVKRFPRVATAPMARWSELVAAGLVFTDPGEWPERAESPPRPPRPEDRPAGQQAAPAPEHEDDLILIEEQIETVELDDEGNECFLEDEHEHEYEHEHKLVIDESPDAGGPGGAGDPRAETKPKTPVVDLKQRTKEFCKKLEKELVKQLKDINEHLGDGDDGDDDDDLGFEALEQIDPGNVKATVIFSDDEDDAGERRAPAPVPPPAKRRIANVSGGLKTEGPDEVADKKLKVENAPGSLRERIVFAEEGVAGPPAPPAPGPEGGVDEKLLMETRVVLVRCDGGRGGGAPPAPRPARTGGARAADEDEEKMRAFSKIRAAVEELLNDCVRARMELAGAGDAAPRRAALDLEIITLMETIEMLSRVLEEGGERGAAAAPGGALGAGGRRALWTRLNMKINSELINDPRGSRAQRRVLERCARAIDGWIARCGDEPAPRHPSSPAVATRHNSDANPDSENNTEMETDSDDGGDGAEGNSRLAAYLLPFLSSKPQHHMRSSALRALTWPEELKKMLDKQRDRWLEPPGSPRAVAGGAGGSQRGERPPAEAEAETESDSGAKKRVAKKVELPDIDQVRRTNRSILTAQVAPIPLAAPAAPAAPPPAGSPAPEPAPAADVPTELELDGVLADLAARGRFAARGALARYCCLARRHRAVNDAKRRVARKAGRAPAPLDLHNAQHRKNCNCCCKYLVEESETSASLAAHCREAMRDVQALLARACVGIEDIEAQLEERDKEDEITRIRDRALEKQRKRKLRREARIESSRVESDNGRTDSANIYNTKNNKNAPVSAAGDDGYQEWIRQKSLNARYFDAFGTSISEKNNTKKDTNTPNATSPSPFNNFSSFGLSQRSRKQVRAYTKLTGNNKLHPLKRNQLAAAPPHHDTVANKPGGGREPQAGEGCLVATHAIGSEIARNNEIVIDNDVSDIQENDIKNEENTRTQIRINCISGNKVTDEIVDTDIGDEGTERYQKEEFPKGNTKALVTKDAENDYPENHEFSINDDLLIIENSDNSTNKTIAAPKKIFINIPPILMLNDLKNSAVTRHVISYDIVTNKIDSVAEVSSKSRSPLKADNLLKAEDPLHLEEECEPGTSTNTGEICEFDNPTPESEDVKDIKIPTSSAARRGTDFQVSPSVATESVDSDTPAPAPTPVSFIESSRFGPITATPLPIFPGAAAPKQSPATAAPPPPPPRATSDEYGSTATTATPMSGFISVISPERINSTVEVPTPPLNAIRSESRPTCAGPVAHSDSAAEPPAATSGTTAGVLSATGSARVDPPTGTLPPTRVAAAAPGSRGPRSEPAAPPAPLAAGNAPPARAAPAPHLSAAAASCLSAGAPCLFSLLTDERPAPAAIGAPSLLTLLTTNHSVAAASATTATATSTTSTTSTSAKSISAPSSAVRGSRPAQVAPRAIGTSRGAAAEGSPSRNGTSGPVILNGSTPGAAPRGGAARLLNGAVPARHLSQHVGTPILSRSISSPTLRQNLGRPKQGAGALVLNPGAGGVPPFATWASAPTSTISVGDFIRDRDPTSIKILCKDRATAMWTLVDEHVVVTELPYDVKLNNPTYFTMEPMNTAAELLLDREPIPPPWSTGGEAPSVVAAPRRVCLEKKFYLKLCDQPLIYAQVYCVLSDLAECRRLMLGDAGVHLFSVRSGALAPVSRHEASGAGGGGAGALRVGLRCDRTDAMKALVGMFNALPAAEDAGAGGGGRSGPAPGPGRRAGARARRRRADIQMMLNSVHSKPTDLILIDDESDDE